jgi:hypothetical protein
MYLPRLRAVLLSLATLWAPVLLAQSANPAGPGTINYVEGVASVDGQPLNQRSVGTVELQPGQVLQTANGKVEMLLTPGVFVRLDDNSVVKMVSPNLTDTEIELDRGRAAVEVDEIHSQNNIQIIESGAETRLVKNGLYEFDAANNLIRVFKGQAEVTENNGDNQKPIKIKGDHQLVLGGTELKTVDFQPKSAEDDLYNWSSLRSEYLAEANADLATGYSGYGGFNPGWYWDSALWGYTWLPGDGLFWNPFGWGFYSPAYAYEFGPVYRGPFRGHGYYPRAYGYGGHGLPPGHFNTFHGNMGSRGGFQGGGFHGGGFHGGMTGGFHGGMGGGAHVGGGHR